MKVKTFHALTMQDALREIKEELGPDAIILSAKEVSEGGKLLRAFNRPVLEVMAASDQDVQRLPQRGEKVRPASSVKPSDTESISALSARTFQQTLQGMLKPNDDTTTQIVGKRTASSKRSSVAHVKPKRLPHLHTVMNELGRLLEDLSREDRGVIEGRPSPMPMPLCRSLVEQGMNPSTADLLLKEACKTEQAAERDDESLRRALHR